MNCQHCSKPIRKFTKHTDWDCRKYHLKCWKQLLILSKIDLISKSLFK